jgi:hypothetical protein
MASNTAHSLIETPSSLKYVDSDSGGADPYYDHPVIISSRSFDSMVAIERTRTLRIRRLCYAGIAVTAASAMYFIVRGAYRIYARHMELNQLMAFHQMRRARKERKRKEAERRALEDKRRAKLRYVRDSMQQSSSSSNCTESKGNDPDRSLYARSHRDQHSNHHAIDDLNERKDDSNIDFPRVDCHTQSTSRNSNCVVLSSDEKSDDFLPYPDVQISSDYFDSSFVGGDIGSRLNEESDEESSLCVICQENRANAVLLDCAHMYTCMDCAQQVDLCPVCRITIKRRLKVFFN